MARVITLVNQKGGTGKTTSCISLGAYLATMGKFVLQVDLDPQANATSGLGFDPEKVGKSLYHCLSGQVPVNDIIKKTKILGCDLIPSSPDLAGARVDLVYQENREFKLREVIKGIRTNYDYILIDCPPSLDLLTINGLVAAEKVIIPVQCEYYALEGLSQLLGTIDLVQKSLQPNLEIMGALLTMHDRRNRLSRQVVKEVQRYFPGYVFEAIVPRSIRLSEAPSYGQTILQYDANSKGGKAYRHLAEEVIKLDLKENE